MALYGIYGSHTTEACPVNNKEIAQKLVQFSETDLEPLAKKYKINQVVGQFHSALEHTFVWVAGFFKFAGYKFPYGRAIIDD